MDERRKDEICHRLTMTNREKITLTGVDAVGSFDDDRIIIYTVEGVRDAILSYRKGAQR